MAQKYVMVPTNKCRLLKRNPQYLTPKQMDSLKRSIERDGFLVPVVVRPMRKGEFEIVSGNHRFLAAQELGIKNIPAVVSDLKDDQAKRVAINLNTIHGEPNAELMAPFLAELPDDILKDIHIEKNLLDDIFSFDDELKKTLERLEVPGRMNNESVTTTTTTCRCPKCGKVHIRAEK